MENIQNSFVLPIKIKSRNELDKTHWAVKSNLKKEYALLIRNQMKLNNFKPMKEPKSCSLYILSKRKRLLDYDNLVGGCKQLIDALTNEGFIWDDSPKFIHHIQVEQIKSDIDETFIKRIV